MIAVTGATGFIGNHLVRRLLAAGERVSILVRSTHWAPPTKGPLTWPNLHLLSISLGDLLHTETLQQFLANSRTLVHCAGIVSGKRPVDVTMVNVKGTANVLAAAEKHGIQSFCYISSAAVEVLADRYADSKRSAEQLIRSFSGRHMIIRPSEIYGPGDRSGITKLVSFIRKWPVLPIIGDGRYTLQPLYIDDLIDIIVHVALRKQPIATNTLTVAGPGPLSFNEIIDTIAVVLNRQIVKISIPTSIALAITTVLDRTALPSPTNMEQVRRVITPKSWDITDTQRLVNFAPRPFIQGIRNTIELLGIN